MGDHSPLVKGVGLLWMPGMLLIGKDGWARWYEPEVNPVAPFHPNDEKGMNNVFFLGHHRAEGRMWGGGVGRVLVGGQGVGGRCPGEAGEGRGGGRETEQGLPWSRRLPIKPRFFPPHSILFPPSLPSTFAIPFHEPTLQHFSPSPIDHVRQVV